MSEGTEFKPLLVFNNEEPQKKKTILFCSGKISYDIQELISKNQKIKENTLLLVIEELFPFPETLIKKAIQDISKSSKAVWVQDEPLNSGPFGFAEPRLYRILKESGLNPEVNYCGRRSLACPAIGYGEGHKRETKEIMDFLTSLCQ